MPKVRKRVTKRTVLPRSKIVSAQSRIRAGGASLVRKNSRKKHPKKTNSKFVSKLFTFLISGLVGLLMIVGVTFLILLRQSDWNQKDQRTILLIDHSETQGVHHALYLFSINGLEKQGAYLSLPSDLQLRALRKYGDFSADSLVSLYEQESLPTKYVEGTLTYNLGMVIDDRLVISHPIQNQGDLSRAFFRSLFHFNSGTLKWGDRFKMWMLVGKVSPLADIAQKYDLFEQTANYKTTFKSSSMDLAIDKYFSRPDFRRQRWNIAVVNLTQESGVAAFWGKRLKQAGFQLINIDSFTPEDEKVGSVVYLSQKAVNDSTIIHTLLSLFPFDLEFKTDPEVIQRFRSDVVVFISQNLVDEYP